MALQRGTTEVTCSVPTVDNNTDEANGSVSLFLAADLNNTCKRLKPNDDNASFSAYRQR